MITLKEALKLSKEELAELKKELIKKIDENSDLNAYIDKSELGEGVPVLVKDNINVKGWDLTCASNVLKGYKAPYNATVVENMLANNVTPFGRANMDEFAMGSSTETSCYGKTLNPRDKERVPGGSSGGSAAAVAGGVAIAALGSDTGGSVRQPASFCGCVGMKPTYGRVSRYGLGAYGSSLDQISPITQNVEDAAILYDIISGYDPKDSTSVDMDYAPVSKNLNPERKLKIGVVNAYVEKASEDVKKAYANTLETLKAQGHELVEVELLDPKYSISAYYVTATAEASTNLARYDGVRYGARIQGEDLKDTYFKSRSAGFGDEVKRRILLGNFVLSSGFYDAYYVKAQKTRALIKESFAKVFESVDLILCPAAPSVAFKFGEIADPLEMYLSDMYTIPVNLAGLPAITVPVYENEAGLPVGLQLIGKAFDEQTVFDGAFGLEKALK